MKKQIKWWLVEWKMKIDFIIVGFFGLNSTKMWKEDDIGDKEAKVLKIMLLKIRWSMMIIKRHFWK